jgi:predicted phosphoribosyltransferase
VSPPDILLKVKALADETVCLEAPNFFQAVGQFYRHFAQVDDEEVVQVLAQK